MLEKPWKKIRRECSSVGSDESGTGGLFGECSFAAFKLTTDNLKKLKSFDWYSKITDSKALSDEENMDISKEIKNNFLKNTDYCIWNMKIKTYNQIFLSACTKYNNNPKKSSNEVKCIAHNYLHQKLNENNTFHIMENFLENETYMYEKAFSDPSEIIPIDHFCSSGFKILSVAIASILARAAYLKKLENIRQTLGIEISDDDNHRDKNGNFKPSKLEPIFKKLEEKGMTREYVYSNYCKADLVKQYEKQIKNKLKN